MYDIYRGISHTLAIDWTFFWSPRQSLESAFFLSKFPSSDPAYAEICSLQLSKVLTGFETRHCRVYPAQGHCALASQDWSLLVPVGARELPQPKSHLLGSPKSDFHAWQKSSPLGFIPHSVAPVLQVAPLRALKSKLLGSPALR